MRRILRGGLLVFTLFTMAAQAGAAEEELDFRVWIDVTGKHKTEAAFTGFEFASPGTKFAQNPLSVIRLAPPSAHLAAVSKSGQIRRSSNDAGHVVSIPIPRQSDKTRASHSTWHDPRSGICRQPRGQFTHIQGKGDSQTGRLVV